MKPSLFRYVLLIASILLSLVLTYVAFLRVQIDTNIVRSMPIQDQVILDALEIFENHPIHDQIAVDLSLQPGSPDQLVTLATELEKKMGQSGLFAKVGNQELQLVMPELMGHVEKSLPLLFSAEELQQDIAPLLTSNAITERLDKLTKSLAELGGIGQSAFMEVDPLGFGELALARLAPLAPTANATLYRGYIFSADKGHLLIVAKPAKPGSDSNQARQLREFFQKTTKELSAQFAGKSQSLQITPVGSYRAALDNEEMIRHDVSMALLLSTLGIGLLLCLTFPRPWLGLLSMLPSVVGVATALFLYSFLFDSISVLVLGFGGALISITVDFGIAYLMLLDRPQMTRGREVAGEIKAIGGRVALLTTAGSFLVLSFSGFPMFAELGVFTALGFVCTYLYVMFIFPRIFQEMSPSSRSNLPLHTLVRKLSGLGKKGAVVGFILFILLLPLAKPVFHISLQDMNSVRPETKEAEASFARTWGNPVEKVYLMTEAVSKEQLAQENDALLTRLEKDVNAGQLSAAFVPSMLYPGTKRAQGNLNAWRQFWTEARRNQVQQDLRAAAVRAGFTLEAFTPFFATLDPDFSPEISPVPSQFYSFFSIDQSGTKGGLTQFTTVQPGKSYDAKVFFGQYKSVAKVFDGPYFAQQLGDILFHTFLWGLVIIVSLVAFFHLLASLSLRLTALTLLPPCFAFVCTLGVLKLIGHPLDIPSLMLAIVIFGMGDDYAIYTVYGYQWYRDFNHPSYLLVRTTVFMAAVSSLIGFGVLCFADHQILRSVGLISTLGVSFSLVGAFLLLPPLLQWHFAKDARKTLPKGASLAARIIARYQTVEAFPRIFARSKLWLDPMFEDLPKMLSFAAHIRTIFDVGCGYGLPACWCLEQYPQAKIIGIDPDSQRVRVAKLATGEQGKILQGWANEIPPVEGQVDLVLLLDMLHYLDNETLSLVLAHCASILAPGGIAVIRHSQVLEKNRTWKWHLEDWRVRQVGLMAQYRCPAELEKLVIAQGLQVVVNQISGKDRELAWMVCQQRCEK